MSAIERLRDGQMFGRYQIVRLLGEGGMGAVYEAIHPVLKKRFAIKTLLPAIAQKEEARIRFLREGEAASSINHPHVVAVSDVGTEDGTPYLVMELLEGQTLGDLLTERGSLPVEEALALLLPVISAVATGHDRGVIHRDLKPQNIFLANGPWGDRIPKVLDFGVSKLTGDDNAGLTRTMTVLGTAAYMSPEQARGAKRVDFQSDQYALGLILYEMLTGTRAHPGENSLEILHNVASGVIRSARELKPDLPDAVDAVMTRMLAPIPADRFRSLHDAGRALLTFSDARTRLALANAFGTSAESQRVGAGEPSGATLRFDAVPGSLPRLDPPSGNPVGATLQLPTPPSGGALNSTLREAASEAAQIGGTARQVSGAKARTTIAAVSVGLALVAAGLIWWAVPRSDSRSSPSSEPGTTVAGAASPAVERRNKSIGSDELADTPSVPVPAVAAETAPAPTPSAAPVPATAPTLAPAPSSMPPSSAPFEIRAVPAEADIELDDGPPAQGHLDVSLPLTGSSHELRVSADGYLPKVVTFGSRDQPPAVIRLDRKSNKPPRPAKPTERPKASDVGATPPKRGSNNALILK